MLDPQRVAAFPDAPTMAEIGSPMVTVAGGQALFAPRGTPATRVNRLARRVTVAAQHATLRERLQQALIRPRVEASAAFTRIVREHASRWQAFIRGNHIAAEQPEWATALD